MGTCKGPVKLGPIYFVTSRFLCTQRNPKLHAIKICLYQKMQNKMLITNICIKLSQSKKKTFVEICCPRFQGTKCLVREKNQAIEHAD